MFSVAGVARYVHYCGDKMYSASYFAKTTCCCGDDDNTDNCCSNEVTVIQVKADFISSEKALLVKPAIISNFFIINSTLSNTCNYIKSSSETISKTTYNYHSPPLYLKNRVFLI